MLNVFLSCKWKFVLKNLTYIYTNMSMWLGFSQIDCKHGIRVYMYN